MPVHELPDIRWKDLGQHVAAIVPISRDEEIIKVIPVKEFEEGKNIMIFTKDGMIKKSELKLYRAQRYSRPLVAINLREDDAVVDIHITDGKQQIFIATNASYGLYLSRG